MTNKIYSMVDGKRIGIAPNLTPRLHRVDSVSPVSFAYPLAMSNFICRSRKCVGGDIYI